MNETELLFWSGTVIIVAAFSMALHEMRYRRQLAESFASMTKAVVLAANGDVHAALSIVEREAATAGVAINIDLKHPDGPSRLSVEVTRGRR